MKKLGFLKAFIAAGAILVPTLGWAQQAVLVACHVLRSHFQQECLPDGDQ